MGRVGGGPSGVVALGVPALEDLSHEELIALAWVQSERIAQQEARIAQLVRGGVVVSVESAPLIFWDTAGRHAVVGMYGDAPSQIMQAIRDQFRRLSVRPVDSWLIPAITATSSEATLTRRKTAPDPKGDTSPLAQTIPPG